MTAVKQHSVGNFVGVGFTAEHSCQLSDSKTALMLASVSSYHSAFYYVGCSNRISTCRIRSKSLHRSCRTNAQ